MGCLRIWKDNYEAKRQMRDSIVFASPEESANKNDLSREVSDVILAGSMGNIQICEMT